MSYFVITKTAYDYNDEVYYCQCDEPGFPVFVSESKEEAENKCTELNLEKIKSLEDELCNYHYDIDDILNVKLFEKITGESVKGGHDWEIPTSISDELLMECIKKNVFFGLKFYVVWEVDNNEASVV